MMKNLFPSNDNEIEFKKLFLFFFAFFRLVVRIFLGFIFTSAKKHGNMSRIIKTSPCPANIDTLPNKPDTGPKHLPPMLEMYTNFPNLNPTRNEK